MAKTVKEILEAYNDNYLSKLDPRFGAKYPPEKDIPNVINLRRKAIRVFPDGQKIALYYSPQLDRYVSIPYGPGTQASGIQVNEAAPISSYQFHSDVSDDLKKAFIAAHRKGDYKPIKDKISKRQVLKMIPMHQAAKYGTVGDATSKALQDYGQKKNKAYYAGQLTGILARGLGRKISGLVKGKSSSLPPEGKPSPKPVPESYMIELEEKWNQLTEDEKANLNLDEWAPLIALGAAVGPAILRGAKRWLKKKFLGGDSSSDSSGGDKESASSYAKRVAKEKTRFKDPQFGNIDVKTSGERSVYDNPEYQFGGRKKTTVQEQKNFHKIKLIAENNLQSDDITFGDTFIKINNRIAKKVVTLYESLNKDNKKKIEEMLDENVNSFKKIINFAIRQ